MNDMQKFEKKVVRNIRKTYGIPKKDKAMVAALVQWISKEAQPTKIK